MALRNSLHRRQHKERSQLAHRSRLGLLEKHKDYVQRARDYRSKRDRIRTLRHKAESRNKDEFYFGMNNTRTRAGIALAQRETDAMGEDMVKVLKSQDEGYLRAARAKSRKRIDSIRTELTSMVDLVHTTDDADDLDEDVAETLREAGVLPPLAKPLKGKGKSAHSNPRHVLFMENDEAVSRYAASRITRANEEADAWISEDDDSNSQLDEGEGEDQYAPARAQKQEAKRIANSKKYRLALLQELSARLKRDIALRHAIRELEMQRHLMAPGMRTKIRGPERIEENDDEESNKKRGKAKFAKQGDVDYAPRVYKWRLERKR